MVVRLFALIMTACQFGKIADYNVPTAVAKGPFRRDMTHALKKNAISFWSNVVIGVASTAPAYSLAAALPGLVAAAKFGVPAILIAAFVPMLFIAVAYYHLNRADPDCGTTFSWATRALGPYSGWLGGWVLIATDILVMPGLAQIAGTYACHLFGFDEPAVAAVTAIGVGFIVAMTAICYFGIELSAHTQKILLAAEVVILLVFAAVALAKVYAGHADGTRIALDWFNPFTVDNRGDFIQAMLIAVFIYWGWDTGAAVNEETENPRTAPARAAVVATVLLVGLYLIVAVAAVAFAEPGLESFSGDDFLAPLATDVLGAGIGKLLIFAVLTSAAACTQTTILPAARTAISMARAGALPKKFAAIHPRYLTPGFATAVMGAVSIAWYLGLVLISDNNVLTDSVTATAIGIAFYYGLTGFACVVYYRHEHLKGIKSFIFYGVIPALGGLIMLALLAAACVNYSDPSQDKTAFYGIGAPLVFGIGALVVGVILMAWARLALPVFFERKREIFDPTRLSQMQ
jgi:amino acid transporter